jgi:hypothetical protein
MPTSSNYFDTVLGNLRKRYARLVQLAKRTVFYLSFKRKPAPGEYSNSKLISIVHAPDINMSTRDFLAFIRCNGSHRLIDDDTSRIFDIALSVYANSSSPELRDYEYLIAGGLNKFKAASQFINADLLNKYKGFIFLDDDLEISYSHLGGFFRFCALNNFPLAQPSLTRDSYYSHKHLLNKSASGWREVDMIEVMCPYFSSASLKELLRTFDMSYSTWGLDFLWPKLLTSKPVVVDEYSIKHTKPVNKYGGFYQYMDKIGISPERELEKLKNMPIDRF